MELGQTPALFNQSIITFELQGQSTDTEVSYTFRIFVDTHKFCDFLSEVVLKQLIF